MATLRPLLIAVGLLAPAAPALALPPPPATVCQGPSFALPMERSTFPANLPAIIVRPNDDSRLPRTAQYHDIQLLDAAGTPIPTTVETHPILGYLLRPDRTLPTGQVTLSFLEECPPGQKDRLAIPVRNQTYRYTVAPASPLPERIGTMTARVLRYVWHPDKPDRPDYALIRLELAPTPELEAFKSMLRLDLELSEGNSSSSSPIWAAGTYGPETNVHEIGYDCDTHPGLAGRKATWNFQLTATLPGAASLMLPPVPVPVEVDCSARVMDMRPDASPVEGPTAGAGGCSYAPVGTPGAALLSIVAALATAALTRRPRA